MSAKTAAVAKGDAEIRFYDLDEHEHPEGHSTMLGFWVYLMSDCLIFAILFASYAVLGGNFAAGPGPKDLFDLPLVALNTAMLLFSSITYGFAMLAMQRNKVGQTQLWLAITGLFGAAFLSAFFTLVGTHGLHVTFGIIWLVTLMVQLGRHGLIQANKRLLMCLSLFWHFLDVIWIGVFTFVYLLGMLR